MANEADSDDDTCEPVDMECLGDSDDEFHILVETVEEHHDSAPLPTSARKSGLFCVARYENSTRVT